MHTPDLTDFEALVTVAEELHFGRAAVRQHMSQPPLSRRIRRMEEDLGVTLFERDNRNVRLTRAGEALLPEARAVLSGARHAAEVARKAASGEWGMLRLGFVPSALETHLPQCIRDFSRARPGVQLVLEERSTVDLLELLRADRLDMAVCRLFEPPAHELESSLFLRETYVLAVPEAHAFARRKGPVTPCECTDFPLIHFPLIHFPRAKGRRLYDAVLAALTSETGGPVVQEVAAKRTALALVEAGLGGALVPRSLAGQKDTGTGRSRRDGEGGRSWRGVRFVELDCPGLPPVEFHLVRAASGAGPAGRFFADTAAKLSP